MFGVQSQPQLLYTLEPYVASTGESELSTAMVSLLVPSVPSLLVIVRITYLPTYNTCLMCEP
ncbi:hypothetical protein LINPERPRIM_LOCUS39025 [Linum perenne]